jgi:YfiH family protein
VARARFSTRADGDLRVTAPFEDLAPRRAAFVEGPWVALRQVHGSTVAIVDGNAVDGNAVDGNAVDGNAVDGSEPLIEADALVTTTPGVVLSVNVADCAPIAIVSPQGVVGAVHAGWKGAEAGVIEETVATMQSLGATTLSAWLGPCIHAECYEFGADDLDRLVDRFGPAVRTRTSSGRDAFDLPMAVAAALGGAGVPLTGSADLCTACDAARFYSFRARRDEGRHALAVWIEK